MGSLLPRVNYHETYDNQKGRKRLFASSVLGRMEYDKDRVYYYTPNSAADAIHGGKDVLRDIGSRRRSRREERANVGAFRATPATEAHASEATIMPRPTHRRGAGFSTESVHHRIKDGFLTFDAPQHRVDLMGEGAEQELVRLGMHLTDARLAASRFKRTGTKRRERSKHRYVTVPGHQPEAIDLGSLTALDQLRDRVRLHDANGKWIDPQFILDTYRGRVAHEVTGGVRIAGHLRASATRV